MTTTFPEASEIASQIKDELLSEELLDMVQPIAIVIPCYHSVSTAFFANFINLTKVQDCPVQVTKGVYVAQAMRLSIKKLMKMPEWRRLVILEADMLPPTDALVKHSLHTDPVVGSVYFQHAPPYHLNCMVEYEGELRHLRAAGIKHMLDNPALYRCGVVGLGCTSVAREVFEQWPEDLPYFRTEFAPDHANDEFTQGEVSHDVWWCREVRKQGHDIFIDTSIICHHITEGATGPRAFLEHHAQEIADATRPSKIIIPKARGRVRVA